MRIPDRKLDFCDPFGNFQFEVKEPSWRAHFPQTELPDYAERERALRLNCARSLDGCSVLNAIGASSCWASRI